MANSELCLVCGIIWRLHVTNPTSQIDLVSHAQASAALSEMAYWQAKKEREDEP